MASNKHDLDNERLDDDIENGQKKVFMSRLNKRLFQKLKILFVESFA